MKLEEMIQIVQDRAKNSNTPMIVRELNAALDEVWKRLYQVFPDVRITFETTGTFSVDTQQFDLGAEIEAAGGEFYGSKTFFLAQGTGEKWVEVVFMDVNDPRFIDNEDLPAQILQPQYASLVNFNQIRLAPAVPSGTLWRSDWIGKPPQLSLATNANASHSIPDPLHQAITDYATSTVFDILDDTRAGRWMASAENKIRTGIHAIKRRQFQTPQGTTPYPSRQQGGRRYG